MREVVTWNKSEANKEKTATVFNDFTYDTETDGGILNKIDEVFTMMEIIETDIEDICNLYNNLQDMYEEFTNYNTNMDNNIDKLRTALQSVRVSYKNLVNDIKNKVTELQKNDESLMEDLESIALLIGETQNKITKSPEDKLKEIYPNGAPQTPEEAYKDIVSVDVPITLKDGTKTTTKVNLNKAVAEDIKAALQEAQDAGFKVYEVQGFNWKGEEDHLSAHCYGLAIDINVAENPCVPIEQAGSSNIDWKPKENEYSIGVDNPLVQAMEKRGWSWGGYWATKKDYMHFSYTNG